MPEGPNRAPGRYEVPVSKGAPCPCVSCVARAPDSLGLVSRTDEGQVVGHVLLAQAGLVRQASERGDAREDGVRLQHQTKKNLPPD